MAPVKMILDVDTGIDDALALLLALKSKDVELVGITTVFGNVDVERATLNTLQVVELAGRAGEVPVAKGTDRPLFRTWDGPVPHIHGSNGIGGYELPMPSQRPIEESAADFIIRQTHEQPGEITLVFVGRLTNLAIALAKDPTIAKKAKRLVLMGGALRVPGNVTPVSEANIWGDPEAAHRVFESGMPITMVGLDVTMEAVWHGEHIRQLKEQAGPGLAKQVDFIENIVDFYFKAYEKQNGFYGSPLHDPLAVAVAFDPSFCETEDWYVQIETKGELSSGATIADFRRPPEKTNASVCVAVHRERFLEHFIRVLSS